MTTAADDDGNLGSDNDGGDVFMMMMLSRTSGWTRIEP
jgi:hypothetical protein